MSSLGRGNRLVFASIVLLLAACGDAPPPPAAAPAPPPSKPLATAPAPHADLAAVARPDNLIVLARLAKPDEALSRFGRWTELPIPGAEEVGGILGGESIAKIIDLSKSIDVAIAVSPSGRAVKPLIAFSAGVRSLEDAKSQLGDKFKLVPGDNGALRIVGLGDDHDECALVPASGAATTRLLCADGGGAMEALGPYLTRTVPREPAPSDLHAEIRLAPVRPLVQQFRGFLPGLVGGMMSVQIDGAAEAVEAAVGDVADLSMDLDTVSIDFSLEDAGATGTVSATFGGDGSLLAQLAVAHPERADVPPAAFWHLPIDADIAHFHRGFDAKDIARPKELLGNLLVGALNKGGLPDGDRKAVVDAAMHYLGLFAGPAVYAKGTDASSTARAVASAKTPKSDAERAALEQFAGWSVTQVDDPIAKVAPVAREWVAAMSRPGVVKWMKDKKPLPFLPTLKLVPLPKASLPDGSLHLVATVPRSLWSDDDEFVPSPADRTNRAPPKKAPSPGKPLLLHVFVVPDGAHTWVTYAGDEALGILKARTVLPSAAGAQTLAKRAGLDTVKDGRANAGGFVSARGLLGASPLSMGSSGRPRGRVFEALAATQGQGAVAIPYLLRAQVPEGATKGSLVVTATMPRAAILDIARVTILLAGSESGVFSPR